jgi:hypothetical protein
MIVLGRDWLRNLSALNFPATVPITNLHRPEWGVLQPCNHLSSRQSMNRVLLLLIALTLLAGCDRLYERAGLPDPAKVQAEGKAIGGACRHAGRGLEDCYALNPSASKSAIFEGWKEMNEYMAKNGMQEMPPQIQPKGRMKSDSKAGEGEVEDEDTKAEQGKDAPGHTAGKG